jgi:hypothetical protein
MKTTDKFTSGLAKDIKVAGETTGNSSSIAKRDVPLNELLHHAAQRRSALRDEAALKKRRLHSRDLISTRESF